MTELVSFRNMAEADVGTRDLEEALRRYEVYREYIDETGVGYPASILLGHPAIEEAVFNG